ncbi:MAG: stage II sporulation protein P [Bacilli bacterium]|nr:stage II sporulation protein P [Bacilli bacterium]
MGHFKTVSKKRKFQIKIIKLITAVLFLLYVISFISRKVNLNSKYLNYLTYSYLGMEFETKKEELETKPVFKNEAEPIIYLYNTHQTESYKYSKLASYNIDYTVMFASYILQSYLEDYNISSVVETTSISKILKENNLKYGQSYQASRKLLEQSVINYPSLKYFIDLHRDSSIYEKTTCELNGEKYAKILFVIGLEHENYQENKIFAEKLNEKLKAVNPCLSRGILEKQGEGVDGKYNQDFNGNTLLLEIGGQYNEINEANNTLKVLASILYEYIMEDS